MSEAWVYAPDTPLATRTARQLAELGYSPRRITVNGSLRPAGDGAGETRPPRLALILIEGRLDDETLGVCARLRADEDLGEVPILVSIDDELLDQAPALPSCDELLVAPWSAVELSARVRRVQRNVAGLEDPDLVRIGSLELNLATYQVTLAAQSIDFTYMEYELLKFLATHPNRVFSREALLSRVWGYDYYGGARTVDVHVRRLRAKLGSEYGAKIKTVRSVGYLMERGA